MPPVDQIIIVAEHHPLFRTECTRILSEELSECLVLENDTVAGALRNAERYPTTDLVILGLSLTDTHNFSGVKRFKQRFPEMAIAVMSAKHDPSVVKHAIDAGASGFLVKTLQKNEFKQAVFRLLNGGQWVPKQSNQSHCAVTQQGQGRNIYDYGLTPTELKVFNGVNRGLLNKQIACELGMAESTVKYHVSKIVKKFGVHSRTQVVVIASKFTH